MLQFLTRLPVNIRVDFDRETIGRGAVYFPFIGMLIGALAAIPYYFLSFISKDIASLGAVFTLVIVTGGLHVDGLSDTVDGFFSARPRERILEIMKDSRVGAFGVIAIVFDILFKFIILKSFTTESGIIALIISCGCSRLITAMLFTFGKSAKSGGLGDMFTSNRFKPYFTVGAALFLIAGYSIAGEVFLIPLVVSILFALTFMRYSYKVIGGLTGDVYGAASEISEILGMLSYLAVITWI